ncbi:MAG: hypothetical protein ABR562_08585 [Thermoplasmatota archaeon]
MVDWPTVALSGVASVGGILVTVLMERRRENVKRFEGLERRLDGMDGRVRKTEQDFATYEPAGKVMLELATADLKKKFRRGRDG